MPPLTGLLVVLLVAHVTSATWINCPSQQYCEFEVLLKSQADWSGVVNTTFLSDLGSCTGYSASYFRNMTKIFDTVVIGTAALGSTDNASSVAFDVVYQLNQATSTAVQSFKSTYFVQSAIYGYTPVIVPSYLRISDEPDQDIFAVLGAVAACLVVLQFGYGYWHFKGFGFITVEKGERD